MNEKARKRYLKELQERREKAAKQREKDRRKGKLPPNVLVKADDISMSFVVPEYKYDTLKERAINFFRGRRNHKRVLHVLNHLSFEIRKGQSLGVIGHNGAGKSTLLKIVSGIYKPTTGTIKTNGKIVLLNLGAGFDMEADAEENIYLNGAILGFSRTEMKKRFESILDFSELRDYVKLPLKNYSSGMVSRLAFAIAIDVHPDLLLVDEVLSVGDTNFQKKCMERILALKRSGVSFLFVSHNINQVKKLCEQTLWIEDSQIMDYGESGEVCDEYIEYCNELYANEGKE